MKISEVLTAARKRLEKPGKWAQGYYAYSRAGDRVNSTSKSAVCFCALGSLERSAVLATRGEPRSAYMDLFNDGTGYLKAAIPVTWEKNHIPSYNDGTGYLKAAIPVTWEKNHIPSYNDAPDRTQEQILALFDRAIKSARKDGN